MDDSTRRKRRFRERRQAGLKAALVWLTPEGQAAMAALRQPGETLDTFVNRALPSMATTPFTLVGNSADSPAPPLRLSPATGHAAEILDV
jgi:hypothetical protein